MSARETVLGRVRAALGDAPRVPDVPRAYRAGAEHEPGAPALVDQLVDRLEDYRAGVVRSAAGDEAVGAAVAGALGRLGVAAGVVTAPAVPAAWLGGVAGHADDGSLVPRELDTVPAVVTGSVVAVSETGTIVLDGSALCGRRALTLVPDVHVCVVRTSDVVETVPEALGRLDPTRPLTFVSGPSATSDIELNRVEGVHGPRTLVVVLMG